MQSLEEKATELGRDQKRLKKRLKIARDRLLNSVGKFFSPGTFDYKNKRWLSNDGSLALQWSVRKRPDEPINYENQQTSIGYVDCVKTDRGE